MSKRAYFWVPKNPALFGMFISVPCLYLRVSRCRNNKKTSYFRLLVLLSFVTTGMWGTIMICTAMIYTRWSAKHATQRNCNGIVMKKALTAKFHTNKPTLSALHMAKFQQNINIFPEVIAHILTYPQPRLMHSPTGCLKMKRTRLNVNNSVNVVSILNKIDHDWVKHKT